MTKRVLSIILALVAIAATVPAFSNAEADPYEHYIGALHQHSGYSDGWPGSTPGTYYASANAHGLDFLGSGEHSDSADIPFVFSEECLDPGVAECVGGDPDPVKSMTKWDATLAYARAATDETFTGFRGFEWTSDRYGHLNVYFSRNDTNAKIDGGYATMETFWQWFRTRAEAGGGADGIATFNHPDSKKLNDADPTKNWNDFAYVPDLDARMVGIEVYNDNREYGSRTDAKQSIGWYAHALDRGWHLGAVGAEDLGHDPEDDWGTPDQAKTVVIAADRSEGALREAMMARRMYAVAGGHNDLRIAMDAAGEPMGARIAAPASSSVPIAVSVTGDASVARIELVSNGGVVVASADGSTIAHEAAVTEDERYYFARVRDAGGRVIAYSSPVWVRAELDFPANGEWVAGDLHIHTTYSHDAWGPHAGDDNTGPDEFWTLGHTVEGQFAVASSRGLDFLAITDHNDIRSQRDPGFGAFGVIPIHGYENSLRGHAQMLGARACLHPEGPRPAEQVTDCNNFSDKTAERVSTMADLLRGLGGTFQLNHPSDGSTDFPHDADWGYGFDVVPDTMEVWNISPLWQPPAPSGGSMDDAIGFWEDFLDRGHRVGATGGSDNHYLGTTAVQGAGQPTTWVWVTERSERGILDGLRAGRTTISFQPPAFGGPRLFLEADADGDGVFEAIVGDEVPAGSQARIRVENQPPGSRVRLITNLGATEYGVSAGGDVGAEELPEGTTWARAELVIPDLHQQRAAACDGQLGADTTYCRNRLLILAMTSAVYVGA